MATVIDALIVTLDLDASKFTSKQKEAVGYLRNLQDAADKHVKPAQKNVNEFEQAMAGLQGRLLAVASLFTGGLGIAAFTEHITKLTAQTGNLARNLGISVKELSSWQGVGASVGATADEMASALASIVGQQKEFMATGRSPLMSFMGQVGLSREGGPSDIMMRLSEWASKHPDKAYASHLLSTRAGMSQGAVNTLMLGPDEIKKRQAEFAQFAPTPAQVKTFQDLQAALAKAQASAEALGRAMIEQLAPAMERLLNSITQINTAFKEKGFVEGNKEIDRQIGNAPGEGIERRNRIFDWIKRKGRSLLGKPEEGDKVGGGDGDEISGGSGDFLGKDLLREGRDTNVLLRDIRSLLGRPADTVEVGDTGFPVGQARRGILEGRRAGGSGVNAPAGMGGRGGVNAPGKVGGGVGSGASGGGRGRAGKEIDTAVPDIGNMTDKERNNLGLILKYESEGRNVMNYMGRGQGLDPATPKGYTAQGYYQMLNTNWNRLAPKLGITTPNAMASSKEDQTKVALALMRERPGAGIGHWANFNPRLRAAIQRGEVANTNGVPDVGGGGTADRWNVKVNKNPAETEKYFGRNRLNLGAAGAITRGGDSSSVNNNTSSTHIGEMNVTVPPGSDPAAYGAGIQQHLERYNNVQNANTGMR